MMTASSVFQEDCDATLDCCRFVFLEVGAAKVAISDLSIRLGCGALSRGAAGERRGEERVARFSSVSCSESPGSARLGEKEFAGVGRLPVSFCEWSFADAVCNLSFDPFLLISPRAGFFKGEKGMPGGTRNCSLSPCDPSNGLVLQSLIFGRSDEVPLAL